MERRKVCVIGAGTMGAGIAAHLANVGFEVSLLDLTTESAQGGLARARSAKPPHFYSPAVADYVRHGAIDDHHDWIAEADWVCEAIVEKLDAKIALFEKIEPLIRPDAMISTNTSGLQIALLSAGRSPAFRRRFLGTHFFNPPRYLKLLELIPTPDTDIAEIERITRLLEQECGRRVVLAKDTPGFIANRFGMWAMFHAIHTAEKLQLSIEQVDAITGPFLGRPRSGTFRLNDIVGLDVMQDIAQNLLARCPEDPYRENLKNPVSLQNLLDKGAIGEKSGMGYYRREGKEFLALDLRTFAYRERQDASFPSLDAIAKKPLGVRICEALELKDEAGEFLREHLIPVLKYADYLKAEISHNVEDFDRVMMWGFGWEAGPFSMIDQIQTPRLSALPGPYFEGSQMLGFDSSYVARKVEPEFRSFVDYPVVHTGEGFLVRDLGEGVLGLGTTTKMGVVTPTLVRALTAYIEPLQSPFILTSEGRSFSAGFDLSFIQSCFESENWDLLKTELANLQYLASLLSTKRSVAAIFGHSLGGGFELAMGCQRVLAHPEATIGLPEAKVGLIPGGSGTVRLRVRHQHDWKELVKVALTVAKGQVSTCAEEAIHLGYLRPTDIVCNHPDRLITDARQAALNLTIIADPEWALPTAQLAGMIDRELHQLQSKGDLTEYDVTIAEQAKTVYAKASSFDEAMQLERDEFLDLVKRSFTQVRVKHMMDTGKPLRN